MRLWIPVFHSCLLRSIQQFLNAGTRHIWTLTHKVIPHAWIASIQEKIPYYGMDSLIALIVFVQYFLLIQSPN